MKEENTMDVHKKAEQWYNSAVIPCRREIQQDICAWYKDTDEQLRQVMELAFYYGYVQAIEDTHNEHNTSKSGDQG